MRRIAITAVAVALLSAGAAAQQPTATSQSVPGDARGRYFGGADESRAQVGERAEALFDRMDANRDGKIDAGDVTLRREQRQGERFTQLDSNRDGMISRAEWDAGHAGRAQARGATGSEPSRGMRAHGGRAGMHAGSATAQLTREAFVNNAYARFDAMDANRDGTVTQAERTQHRTTMRQQRQR